MNVRRRRQEANLTIDVLIGEPGVGKTAIAEGIAHRIASGDVPESLKCKRILALDPTSTVAGSKYPASRPIQAIRLQYRLRYGLPRPMNCSRPALQQA